ncbi:PQQ-dependent sugar dehydrogenase [Streptomyces sp. NPDC002896]|uniref:PQQ-dependent sugar dehydrogenase n=1 Tax=Streptomyces sp. NPDC002896 TaxID=3154438 RepID=UPI00331EBE6E
MVASMLMGFAAPGSGAAAPPGDHARTQPVHVRHVSAGWTTPWGLSWLPDRTALISERNSFRIYRLDQAGAKRLVGTVPQTVPNVINEGVLGIAVSPTWARDHYIYVMHTASEGNRIARMTYNGSTLSGYTILLRGIKKDPHHNGGRLKFGPDGFLYAATGDANQTTLPQNIHSPNGKILRMTASGAWAPGNPFNNYVYSYGHRNPQGLTWDAQGRLWEAEFGPNRNDEVNLIEPGKNYGWPRCAGPCTISGMTNPKVYWPSTADASPSGLAYADGNLYVGALRGQRLWRVPVNGTTVGTPVAYYRNVYGRLRTVEKVPGRNAVWVLTSNADKVANKPAGSDRVIEVQLG